MLTLLKKTGCCALAVVLSLSLLVTGCSKSPSTAPAEITQQVIENNNFSKLKELSGDQLSSYFQFKNTDVKRFSAFISDSTDLADTVAAFETETKDDYNLVITGVSKYLTKLSSAMQTSFENEYDKTRSALIMHIDNTVILVVSSDFEKIEAQLKELGAKAVY
ncbi:MAG: DUF4358 domain-containing protein [Clostridia bacterium]|nr:DUF4358 domain-containing protein [Clostridia bacterium]